MAKRTTCKTTTITTKPTGYNDAKTTGRNRKS